ILLPEGAGERLGAELRRLCGAAPRPVPEWVVAGSTAARTLRDHFGVATLEGFGLGRSDPSLGAAAAILHYLGETQRTALAHLTALRRFRSDDFLFLDQGSRARLDLEALVRVLDETVTAGGGRLLREWLHAPLTSPDGIARRQEAVEELVGDRVRRRELRAALEHVRDVERILSRAATSRVSPRDLDGLRTTLGGVPTIESHLDGVRSETLERVRADLDPVPELWETLCSALADAPPPHLRDGGVIRSGFCERLDRLRALRRDGKAFLRELRAREIGRTGIESLKIGFNRVFGYYIEITHAHKDRVPDDYIRKQTLTQAERYITPELKEYETQVLSAEERANAREAELFEGLRQAVVAQVQRLQRTAALLGELDVLCALATAAVRRRYVRPVVDGSDGLEISGGRHPVVEQALTEERFVPNDLRLDLSGRTVAVLTGPNMAGKSTYVRQAALIVLMAQAGSFVPASRARIGVVDRIFTRIGAEDDLAGGRSTFMVEMAETAAICHHATRRSLVILDEVGRGTSTFDGVAIAWAVTEHLAGTVGCRTLFATHYHELTALAAEIGCVFNLHVAVEECGDEVAFLHRIQEGGTDRSYGIHVARLAGLPRSVVDRARALLGELSGRTEGWAAPPTAGGQLSLFPAPGEDLRRELAALDPEQLSPIDALLKLRALVERARGKGGAP
ncbi:MAG: DNA mismatch repair protein MutS, partial [Planctomycetota bacterium]